MAVDPLYKICAFSTVPGHVCGGRVTWEHALTFSGRKIQIPWAIIPICARAHEVDEFQDAHTMNKEMNVWVALNRATDDELRAVSKSTDYIRERDRLNRIYGVYTPPVPAESEEINYGNLI